MTTARMLFSSMILTVCLVTIGIVVLLFTGEESPLKNSTNSDINELTEPAVQRAVVSDVGPSEEELPVVTEGIRAETDALGLHDILFESGTVDFKATSGPVTVTVYETRLERLTAADESIKKALEGRVTSTVVVLNVHIENTSSDAVIFKLDEAKVIADMGEKAVINPKLSTTFGTKLAPNSKKSGVLMIDMASKAKDIASVTVKVFPTYNTDHDELGEAIELKIPMY